MGLINLSNPGRATLVTGQELVGTELPTIGRNLGWSRGGGESDYAYLVKLEATSESGYAYITVHDQNYPSTVTKNVAVYAPSTATLDIDFRTTHAASTSGLQTGVTRTAGVFYEIRLVTEANGANPRLLATPAGTAVNLNSGTTGHVLVSKVLWGVVTVDGGEGVGLYNEGWVHAGTGKCIYQTGHHMGGAGYDELVIGGDTTSDGVFVGDPFSIAATGTAVSLAPYIPELKLMNQKGRVFLRCRAESTSTTFRELQFFFDWYGSETYMDFVASAHRIAEGTDGEPIVSDFNFSVPIGSLSGATPANLLRMRWNGGTDSPQSAKLWCLGWEING